MLDEMQKVLCKAVPAIPPASLETLAHHRNVTNVTLFYMYYSKRCSSELVEIVPIPSSHVKSTRYSVEFHDLSVTKTTVMITLCQQLL